MFKIEYDLMNDEHELTFLGFRISDRIAILLLKLGIIQDTTEEN